MCWVFVLCDRLRNLAAAEQRIVARREGENRNTVQSGSCSLYFMYMYVVTATAHELAHLMSGSTLTVTGMR